MNGLAIAHTLLLLAVANGAPIIARNLLRNQYDRPIDGGVRWRDGRPLLGASKTVRGLVAAVTATALAGLLIGPGAGIGAACGMLAMAGDLASSFVKRRLGAAPSEPALLIDQVPEALLPSAVLAGPLGLAATDVAAVVAAFLVLELTLSRVLYRLHVRNRPS